MKTPFSALFILTFCAGLIASLAQEVRIEVQAGDVLHPVSRYLTGACIEDVNHEVYGGIDSQMIFGESFAEPAPPAPLRGFTAYGGRWLPKDGELHAAAGEGPKLISNAPGFREGEASIEVYFPEEKGGNAGLILKVSHPGLGADRFTGYEVSLESGGRLVLGRHRQNWEPIRQVPCEVPVRQWIKLTARMTSNSLEVLVNDRVVTRYVDEQHPLEAGTFGLRTWQREAWFRNLSVTREVESRKQQEFTFSVEEAWGQGVSGMWRACRRGNATGEFRLEEQNPFSGRQSQRVAFTVGEGEIGIENQSLNRWGMNLVGGKVYEGFVCVRADQPTELFVALESRDGLKVHAEKRLKVSGRHIPIATSANCLQPDGQNDNDWNQGLLFLNPWQVWLQPPGYVTQMLSRNYLPRSIRCEVTGAEETLDVSAKRSPDGRTLALQAVNSTDKAIRAQIRLDGFVPRKPLAQITELAGPLGSRNTADQPHTIEPQKREWRHSLKDGSTTVYTFPAYSVNVLRFE